MQLAVKVCAALLVFSGAVGANMFIASRSLQDTSTRPPAAPSPAPDEQFEALVTAQQASFDPEAEVIGVVANGVARAYLVDALAPADVHVYNDVLDGTPVSVTYCGLDDFARVFVGEEGGAPLNLTVAGRYDGQMCCLHDGQMFGQRFGDAPLEDLPFARTTWAEWVAQHPASKVYVGRQ